MDLLLHYTDRTGHRWHCCRRLCCNARQQEAVKGPHLFIHTRSIA
jgi:hypothetical protein